MPQSKDIKKLPVIADLVKNPSKAVELLSDAFSVIVDLRCLATLGNKCQGYVRDELFMGLLLSPFINCASVLALAQAKVHDISLAKKDAYYELLNNSNINWRKMLLSFAKSFAKATKMDIDSEDPKCFILDDTTIEKTGSKIEGISYVFDHGSNSFRLGFKMLTLGFFDGTRTIPLDFTLHSESSKNKKGKLKSWSKKLIKLAKNTFKKQRKEGDKGQIRIKELKSSKITEGIKLLKRAVKSGFSAKYVLVDSWFTCKDMLEAVRSMCDGALHFIGMVKKDARKYDVKNQQYSAKQLIAKRDRTKRYNRKLRMNYFSVKCTYKGIAVVLFFCKLARQKEYRIIMTTDNSLKINELIKIYQIRWSIEVLFRDAKQNLYLGKTQSNDFDAQIAGATLAMMRYILISQAIRGSYFVTVGGLFREVSEKLLARTQVAETWDLFISFIIELSAIIDIDWTDLKAIHSSEYSLILENLKKLMEFNNPVHSQ